MPLIDLATARDACNITSGDATKDAWLVTAIDAASEVIEYHAGRAAGSRTVALNGGKAELNLPDAPSSVTSVTVDGVATTDYSVNLAAGILSRGTGASAGSSPFPYGVGNVVVVYVVAEVAPSSKARACTELVQHWFQNGQQGSRPAFGGAAADAPGASTYAVPRRVMELLAPSGPTRMPGFA